MTYSELLLSQEWLDKRNEIMARDNFVCQVCHNKSYFKSNFFSPLFGRETKKENILRVYGYPLNTGKIVGGFFNASSTPELTGILAMRKKNQTMIAFSIDEDIFSVQAIFEIPFKMDDKLSPHSIIEQSSNKTAKKELKIIASNLKKDIFHNVSLIKWHYVKGLQVHHKYYKINTLPWEYEGSALQTCCPECHKKIHLSKKIYFKDLSGKNILSLTPCKRCSGIGWLPKYKHVEDGICFECMGSRFYEFLKLEDLTS